MEKYGFVYIWYDRKHKRYYIGCRWGHVKDGYICSSTWMKSAYKRRPQDFKRRILETNITDRRFLLDREYYWLQMISDDEIGIKYYNLSKRYFGHWVTDVDKLNKIKEGNISRKKGVPLSEEHKQKLRAAAKNRTYTAERNQKISTSRKGMKFSEEHRKNISMVRLGKVQSEESKQKQSNAMKGRRFSDTHIANLKIARRKRMNNENCIS